MAVPLDFLEISSAQTLEHLFPNLSSGNKAEAKIYLLFQNLADSVLEVPTETFIVYFN